MYWDEDITRLDVEEIFDPLCVERSAPVSDEEAAQLEALCRAATPGPLVVDDETEGNGAVVVSLPDGRVITSMSASVEHTEDEDVLRANVQLICKARYELLRLIRDRRQWHRERELLLERIRTLETRLGITDGKDAGGPQSLRDTVPMAVRPK